MQCNLREWEGLAVYYEVSVTMFVQLRKFFNLKRLKWRKILKKIPNINSYLLRNYLESIIKFSILSSSSGVWSLSSILGVLQARKCGFGNFGKCSGRYKQTPCKFRILHPKNSRAIYPRSLYVS